MIMIVINTTMKNYEQKSIIHFYVTFQFFWRSEFTQIADWFIFHFWIQFFVLFWLQIFNHCLITTQTKKLQTISWIFVWQFCWKNFVRIANLTCDLFTDWCKIWNKQKKSFAILSPSNMRFSKRHVYIQRECTTSVVSCHPHMREVALSWYTVKAQFTW